MADRNEQIYNVGGLRVVATPEELRALPPEQQARLGISAPPLNTAQRIVEGIPLLSQRKLLRSIFNLDVQYTAAPKFDPEQDVLGKGHSWYKAQLAFELDRNSMYQLAEEMDTFGLCASALDLYSEDATQRDQEQGKGRSVWIRSSNQDIKKELMNLFDRIGLEDEITGLARTMCKYGDDFEQVITSPDRGIIAIQYVEPNLLTRIEDEERKLLGFAAGIHRPDDIAKTDYVSNLRMSEPWDFVHFRLPSSRRETRHGEALLAPARRTWRQLKIVEDSMVMYRINRAPDRMVYYVDVGEAPIEQQFRILHRWRNALRRRLYMNPSSGQMDQEWNPWSEIDDLFWPVSKDSNSRVDQLSGSSNADQIHDIEYWRDKFFAECRIPKAYMGYEGDVNAKATLWQQDVRYARGCKKVQKALIYGLTVLCRMQLALRGINPDKPENAFTVCMTPISYLDELQMQETLQVRTDMARAEIELADLIEMTDKQNFFIDVLVNRMQYTRAEAEKWVKGSVDSMEPSDGQPYTEPHGPDAVGLDDSTEDEDALVITREPIPAIDLHEDDDDGADAEEVNEDAQTWELRQELDAYYRSISEQLRDELRCTVCDSKMNVFESRGQQLAVCSSEDCDFGLTLEGVGFALQGVGESSGEDDGTEDE